MPRTASRLIGRSLRHFAAPGGGRTFMKIHLLAMAALGALVMGVPVQVQAQCPGGQCEVPGTGSPATECIVEWPGVTPNYGRGRCPDGAPSCALDGVANGLCRSQLSACLNNNDSRYPDCPPSDVASFELRQKPATS